MKPARPVLQRGVGHAHGARDSQDAHQPFLLGVATIGHVEAVGVFERAVVDDQAIPTGDSEEVAEGRAIDRAVADPADRDAIEREAAIDELSMNRVNKAARVGRSGRVSRGRDVLDDHVPERDPPVRVVQRDRVRAHDVLDRPARSCCSACASDIKRAGARITQNDRRIVAVVSDALKRDVACAYGASDINCGAGGSCDRVSAGDIDRAAAGRGKCRVCTRADTYPAREVYCRSGIGVDQDAGARVGDRARQIDGAARPILDRDRASGRVRHGCAKCDGSGRGSAQVQIVTGYARGDHVRTDRQVGNGRADYSRTRCAGNRQTSNCVALIKRNCVAGAVLDRGCANARIHRGQSRRAERRNGYAGNRDKRRSSVLADKLLSRKQSYAAGISGCAFKYKDVIVRRRIVARAVIQCLKRRERGQRIRQTATAACQSSAGRRVVVDKPDHSRDVDGHGRRIGQTRAVRERVAERVGALEARRWIVCERACRSVY